MALTGRSETFGSMRVMKAPSSLHIPMYVRDPDADMVTSREASKHPSGIRVEVHTSKIKEAEDINGMSELLHLRQRLAKAEQEARMWKSRVAELEKWVVQAKDASSIEISRLMSTNDLSKAQMRQQEKGISLWKQREKQLNQKLTELIKRMDEMGAVIRNKDAEIQMLLLKNENMMKDMEILNVKLRNTMRRGVYDVMEVVPANIPHKKPALKLPTLVSKEKPPDNKDPVKEKRRVRMKLRTTPSEKDQETNNQDDAASRSDGNRTSMTRAYIHCFQSEEWVDHLGQLLETPNATLDIPSGCMKNNTCITLTEREPSPSLKHQTRELGLDSFVYPAMCAILHPASIDLSKPAFLYIRWPSTDTLLAFQKDADLHKPLGWIDVTSTLLTQRNGTMIKSDVSDEWIAITFTDMSVIQLFGVSAKPKSVKFKDDAGRKTESIAKFTLSMLNGQYFLAEFSVMLDSKAQRIVIVCNAVNSEKQSKTKLENHRLFSRQISNFPVFHDEVLLIYISGPTEPVKRIVVNEKECKTTGQRVTLPIQEDTDDKTMLVLPPTVTIKRILAAGLAQQEVCRLVLSGTQSVAIDPNERCREVIQIFSSQISRTVDIKYLLSLMRQERTFSNREIDKLCKIDSRELMLQHFLRLISIKGSQAFDLMCGVLADPYPELAQAMVDAYNK